MSNGIMTDPRITKTGRMYAEAMRRLRSYDQANNRPGRTFVNFLKVGRNDPCPCGSKRKWKQCCMGKA